MLVHCNLRSARNCASASLGPSSGHGIMAYMYSMQYAVCSMQYPPPPPPPHISYDYSYIKNNRTVLPANLVPHTAREINARTGVEVLLSIAQATPGLCQLFIL